jgi:hypothetical protein
MDSIFNGIPHEEIGRVRYGERRGQVIGPYGPHT